MAVPHKSILLIGESAVGKSHYGGQLLKRLMREDGQLRMDGAATNLEPFQAVMACLDAGLSADHTPTPIYHESRWPIIDNEGHKADLVWPDYGGEQIKNIIDHRQMPHVWLNRITQSLAWLLLIRLQKIRADDDIFSRPLESLKEGVTEARNAGLSDQARLIELMQMLTYIWSASNERVGGLPPLVVLLTCWDEMERPGKPIDEFCQRLPLFGDFIASNWEDYSVLGLSALGQALDKKEPDEGYIAKGSEEYGYVVMEDGTRCADLTHPIRRLITARS
jgi:hypothetical protein